MLVIITPLQKAIISIDEYIFSVVLLKQEIGTKLFYLHVQRTIGIYLYFTVYFKGLLYTYIITYMDIQTSC